MANLPEITYRYPTLQHTSSTEARPSIYFDWSTDMVTTQFSDSAQRAKFFMLIDEATSVVLDTDYVGYTAASRRFEIKPTNNLEPNKTYRVLIKSRIQSTDGRKSANEYHWVFQTASGSVDEITLLAPGNSTIQNAGPTLFWTAVTFTGSASADTVNYLVQLSDRFDFGTTDFTTTTTATSALPNYIDFIQEDTTYYWRVLPHTISATGNWSDVWSFYYGLPTVVDPAARQRYPDADNFAVSRLGFKTGASNLTAFPTISVTFTSAPTSAFASYVQMLQKDVLPRNDDADSYLEESVPGGWDLSGNTLTFTPSGTIATNKRYEVRIDPYLVNTSNIELAEEYSFWFTGRYTPLYVAPRVIRARFLGAEQKVPDDLINFYIYLASLEANARYWGQDHTADRVGGDQLLETTVRDQTNLRSFGVLKWVEAAAAYKILKAILFEHLRDIGRTERIGDSLVSLTKDFIDGIEAALKLIKEELDQWENYLTPSDVPLSVSKSSRWSPGMWDYDWSIAELEARRDGFCG